MNKAITDGIIFMPPAFETGLDIWSSEDGRPNSATYLNSTNGYLIASDSDFGSCLELSKTTSTQKLRYMGQTPLPAGCYLQVKVRMKAISGPLPNVRIAAWAGAQNGNHVGGVNEVGTEVTLTNYGQIKTVSAIIGTGARAGVDMPWGRDATYAHVGLDLTGATGGIVRVENISVEDVSSIFYRDLLDVVDVTDYGAIGDGVFDCQSAFEAADADANGRSVLVPEGQFYLSDTVTINSEIKFEGTITMPSTAILSLTQNYDFPTYVEAFGNEQLAFQKAFQALLNFSDHESLDLCGRRIELTEPMDMQAIVGNRDQFPTRRVIRNGLLNAAESAAWDTDTVTSNGNYSASSPNKLTNVANVNQIEPGSRVEGTGVAAETYVESVDTSAKTVSLSNPLWGAPSSQSYTFSRYKYLLDFSGFTKLQRFSVENIDFLCNSRASGMMLARDGLSFQVRECYFTNPKDRGITSFANGCAGLQIDENQFLSREQALDVPQRTTVAFNVNSNDAKIRNNRSVRFKHFAVMNGAGHMFIGNHFFQGDNVANGQRTAGIILSNSNCKTLISSNYIDNSFIEWGNASDPTPDNNGGFSFGGLTIASNIFTANGVANWFSWIQIKPYGDDHYVNGLNISGNVFKHINGNNIDRVDKVVTTYADLDHSRNRNITVQGNTFNGVIYRMQNPVTVDISSQSLSDTWVTDAQDYLPFGSNARVAVSVLPNGPIRNSSNVKQFDFPYAVTEQGSNKTQVELIWKNPVKGSAQLTLRCDNPE